MIQISPTSNKLYSLISIEKFAIKFQIEFMKFKNERTKSRKQQKGEYPNSNFWKVWTVCANFYWNRLRNKVFIQEYIIFWNIINKQRNKIFPNFWQFFNFLTIKNLPSGLFLMNGSFCLKFHHNSIKIKVLTTIMLIYILDKCYPYVQVLFATKKVPFAYFFMDLNNFFYLVDLLLRNILNPEAG